MIAETLPGPAAEDGAALLAYARARGSTVYHAVGTCRMGADPLAVVAPCCGCAAWEGCGRLTLR